jgi:probable HAF family extracellular repeat protein/predicted outer membrane repeat protein
MSRRTRGILNRCYRSTLRSCRRGMYWPPRESLQLSTPPIMEALEPRLLLSSVSGIVFADENHNGVQNSDDFPLRHWIVFADANFNGRLDPGEQSSLTNTDGTYSIDNLPNGSYDIAVVGGAAWGVEPQTVQITDPADTHQVNLSSPDAFQRSPASYPGDVLRLTSIPSDQLVPYAIWNPATQETLVTWIDTSVNQKIGQRFDADGQPIGSPVQLGASLASFFNSRYAVDDSGNYYIEFGNIVQRYSPTLVSIGNAVVSSSMTAVRDIAVDQNGNVALAGTHYAGGFATRYSRFQTFAADGTPLSPTITLADSPSSAGNAAQAEVALFDANGDVIVIDQHALVSTGLNAIFFSKYSLDGQVVLPRTQIATPTAGVIKAVAIKDGSFVVTMQTGDLFAPVKYMVVSEDGTVIQPLTKLNVTPDLGTGSAANSGPVIVREPRGNVLATWTSHEQLSGGGGGQDSDVAIYSRSIEDSGEAGNEAHLFTFRERRGAYGDYFQQIHGFSAGAWGHHYMVWSDDPKEQTGLDTYFRTFGTTGRAMGRLGVDVNGDEVLDGDEPPLDVIPIKLYRGDGSGQFDPSPGMFIGEMTSGTDGGFAWPSPLSFGDYWLEVDEDALIQRGFALSGSSAQFRLTLSSNEPLSVINIPASPSLIVSTAVDEQDGNYAAGDLSLREALFIAQQNGGNATIRFAPELSGSQIVLAPGLGQLAIQSNVNIIGPPDRVTISGNGTSRVVFVGSEATVTVSDLIISEGSGSIGGGLYVDAGATVQAERVDVISNSVTQRGGGLYVGTQAIVSFVDSTIADNASNQLGGGIFVDFEGALTLDRVTVSDNYGRNGGGGLYVNGVATLHNTTVSGNSSQLNGGGIVVEFGDLTMVNATVAHNRADADANGTGTGGGVRANAASVLLHNTLIAANLRGQSTEDDLNGSVDSVSSHNLIGAGGGGLIDGVNGNLIGTSASPIDARLLPLDFYGGPTRTHALAYNSPAIEAGDNAAAIAADMTTDQRGVNRYRDFNGDDLATVDIGAVEMGRVITVNSLLDELLDTDGLTSLREALAQADATPGLDVIQFDPSLFHPATGELSVILSLGELTINSSVEIHGLPDGRLTIDGDGLSRVFRVTSSGWATMIDLTIKGGLAATGAGVRNDGRLDLYRVLFTGNTATLQGGAIYNTTDLFMGNVTLSANSAEGQGGGLYNQGGTAELVHLTVLDNETGDADGGGGVFVFGGSVAVRNSVVARNLAGGLPQDVAGTFHGSSTHNFIGNAEGVPSLSTRPGTQSGTNATPIDPMLGPLDDNGGATRTHRVLPASPVTDAGLNIAASDAGLTTDQRGLPRFRDGTDDGMIRVDIGAFEQQYPLNQAPLLSTVDTLRGAVEDAPFVISHEMLLAASDAVDPEGAVPSFLVEAVYVGTLTIDGTPVVPGQTLLVTGKSMVWTPPSIDFNGESTATLAAFAVRAWDGLVSSESIVDVEIEVTSNAEKVNYVVLFSGGDNPSVNYGIYYDNLKEMYLTVVNQYGVKEENIYVIYADGRNPAPDQRGGTNSDMSFAQNVLPATAANLRSTLMDLSQRVDGNDHFMFWSFDHGLGLTNRPDVVGEEVLVGWGPGELISDEELRVWLQGLQPGDAPSYFGVPAGYSGINAGFSSYIFAQCFAGGILDNLTTGPNVFGAAASNHYEASYSDFFASAFTRALKRGHNNTHDAFRFATDHNSRARIPNTPNGGTWQFGIEHPWSVGGLFPFFALPDDLNAPPSLTFVRPLKIQPERFDLDITYDMLVAASNAADPSGQAVVFNFVGVDIGQLHRNGQPINFADASQTRFAVGDIVQWIRPVGTSGTLNAIRINALDMEGGPATTPVTVPIRIGSPSTGPTAVNDQVLIQENSVNSLVRVLGNDTGGNLAVVSVGVANHGVVTFDAQSNLILYTPSRDFRGTDRFTYYVSNGSATDMGTVSIEVVAYDPLAAGLSGVQFIPTELPPPPGWAGLPEDWTWDYRQTIPDWENTFAVGISEDGWVAVKTSRPVRTDNLIDFVGSTNAGYRWQAGDTEPFWNWSVFDFAGQSEWIGSTNTFILLDRTEFTFNAQFVDGQGQPQQQTLPVYHGIEPLSINNPWVTPTIRYLDPNNANEAGFPSIAGFWFDAGTSDDLWQVIPQDLIAMGSSSVEVNNPQYLVAVTNTGHSLGMPQRAEMYMTSRSGISGPLATIMGWGGAGRSEARAINDLAQMVGWAEYQLNDYHAFVYDHNTQSLTQIGALPGHAESVATAINNQTQVVGFSTPQGIGATQSGVAFIWDAVGGMTSLGTLADFAGATDWSYAHDINNSGMIVGESNGRAFLYHDGLMYDLNALFSANVNIGDYTLVSATGINDLGQIVATGRHPSGHYRAFFLDIISELIVNNDAFVTGFDQPLTGNVLANDTGGRVVLAVDDSNLIGALDFNLSTGGFTYDPSGFFDDLTPGSFVYTWFTYQASDLRGSEEWGTVEITITRDDLGTFHVSNFQPNASGFEVTFSGPIDLTTLNLYAGLGGPDAEPDVVLKRNGNTVPGSLIWNAHANSLQFVATGSVLPAGEYHLTLFSRPDGIVSDAGDLLDGDRSNTPGGDFVHVFTVSPSTARVVSLPDIARGPGQPVNLPADGSGLPITISNGLGVQAINFTLMWDPALLHVSGVSLGGDMGGWSLTSNLNTPGQAIVSMSSTTALPSGIRTVLILNASVPDTAPYGASNLIHFSALSLNGGDVNAIPDKALHKVAFVGDTSGNASYSGYDAALIHRVATQLDSGFSAYPLTDPLILGNVHLNQGAQVLDAMDASLIARQTLYLLSGNIDYKEPAVPQLPDFPPVAFDGIDPVVSLPALDQVQPGDAITLPMLIDEAADLLSFEFTIQYDPAVLALNPDVTFVAMGWLIENMGWQILADLNEQQGRIAITGFSTGEAMVSSDGELLKLNLQVRPDAPPGTSALVLDGQLNEGRLFLTPVNGQVTIVGTEISAMVVGRHIFYNRSAWDGNNAAANPSDDAAIAPNKTALLPGQSATFVNYTSYSRGINGIMIDVSDLANPAAITAADFTFKVGNSSNPSAWATAPAPVSVTVREGAGVNGSDRITIIWADNAIQKQWLQVTMLANERTGLLTEDVHYWGNAIGESGNSNVNAVVNLSDVDLTRNNQSGFVLVDVTNPFDYDRDRRVNVADVNIARSNQSGFIPLNLITVPGTIGALSVDAGEPEASTVVQPLVAVEHVSPTTVADAASNDTSLLESDLGDQSTDENAPIQIAEPLTIELKQVAPQNASAIVAPDLAKEDHLHVTPDPALIEAADARSTMLTGFEAGEVIAETRPAYLPAQKPKHSHIKRLRLNFQRYVNQPPRTHAPQGRVQRQLRRVNTLPVPTSRDRVSLVAIDNPLGVPSIKRVDA